ncbi:hypothetical protein [Nostoc sp. UHCC 0870]|uniref:hypothetical protein n=1 Tax=Nostoc sp. UHCC 0870 TaxID=2914041 RepID=UPI001EDE7140|nr:hypothetical protein [Nostoc sp. UHCC 0870]UKO99895.1 hypothetical protein L6494_09390 [Nostoc sp. UHCC 0870]
MLTIQWQEEIVSLQQSLRREITKISDGSDINVIKHICINNLKSKLERLEEIEKILSIEKYKIVFIGTIGQGKTTAICHLFNLISDFRVSKTINGKTRDAIGTKALLSTGSGKTTICEVIIKAADKTYIEIEPYTVDEMENLIFEFCNYIANKENPQSEQRIIISEEIQRAIRNVIELKRITKSVPNGEKSKSITVDQAQELFEEAGIEVLKKTALNNANLESRTSIRIEFDNQSKEQEWIKNNFDDINNVRLKDFAIPRKIYLYVSHDVLSGSNLSQFDSVVDTKGLDENPIRKDLQKYIDSQDSICLFVTPFNAAPEANITKLIGYHLTSKSKEFHHRFVTLVLPHKGEPEKVHDSDGDRELGLKIRQDEVQSTFRNLNLEFFQDNILFYDSLRYYRDDIVKVYEEYKEDVQEDKNELIRAINDVIERRRNLLLDEIKDIRESFGKIKNGEALTVSEIKAIEKAIQKIENIREYRVPSFVYEGSPDKEKSFSLIDQYIQYYRTTHKAWNTKHAIHRNFGYYEPRDIDIYYDAKVVAEGIGEDEMLKKFTREVKQELENVLCELTYANESLKTLIPELIREFYSLYDEFIYNVGTEIQDELTRKLLPQSEDSKFWNALIAEKGKEKRSKGETYTDNVCAIFKRELTSEINLNKFYQSKAEEHWKELVNKILSFFGQK